LLMASAAVGLALTSKKSVLQVADAIGKTTRPSVIWLHFQDCTGCTETLLRTSAPDVAHLILDVISLDYQETLMAVSGAPAEAALKAAVANNAGKYVLVVEGAIPAKDNGVYVELGGRPGVQVVREVAEQGAAVVAIGSCALGRGDRASVSTSWDGEKKYSWVKAPRFNSQPMQVGPLARVLIGYAQGHPLTRKYTDLAIAKIQEVAGVRVTPDMLHSTLGRHAARAIRAAMLAELAQKHWQLLVDNIAKGDYTVHNQPVFSGHEVEGVGTHEAPRGRCPTG
jgi:hypothetical protein